MALTTDDIAPGERLVLDTSVIIAYLQAHERASPTARLVMDGLVATERNPAVVSAITVTELLVGSLSIGAPSARTMRTFLFGFTGLSVRSADFLVAAEAASIRVATRATTTDALIAATATLTTSHWLITNDRELRDRLSRLEWQTRVLLLDDVRDQR